MRQIILASGSPRRKALLEQMGVRFEVIPSDYDEQLDDSRSPEDVAKELGLGKALAVARRYPEAIVIGSDTIVSLDGKQFGKAKDEQDARRILTTLSGRYNDITSSVAVLCLAEKFEVIEAAQAKVYMKPFDEPVVEVYLQTGDWHDKAGAYGVQSGAAPLVEYIDGRYDAVLGLPTDILARLLWQFGIDAHEARPTPPKDLRFKKRR